MSSSSTRERKKGCTARKQHKSKAEHDERIMCHSSSVSLKGRQSWARASWRTWRDTKGAGREEGGVWRHMSSRRSRLPTVLKYSPRAGLIVPRTATLVPPYGLFIVFEFVMSGEKTVQGQSVGRTNSHVPDQPHGPSLEGQRKRRMPMSQHVVRLTCSSPGPHCTSSIIPLFCFRTIAAS